MTWCQGGQRAGCVWNVIQSTDTLETGVRDPPDTKSHDSFPDAIQVDIVCITLDKSPKCFLKLTHIFSVLKLHQL